MTIDTSIKSLNGWVFMDDYGQLYTISPVNIVRSASDIYNVFMEGNKC